METPPTRTYLNDHRVGAGVAIGIIDRLLVIGRRGRRHDSWSGSSSGSRPSSCRTERRSRRWPGWSTHPSTRSTGPSAGSRAAWPRVKLTAPMSGSETGAVLLGLEALATGIQGKAALWRSLRAAGNARLAPVDLAELIRRAETQFSAVEAARLETSRVVLAG